jgi:hypothetical protein
MIYLYLYTKYYFNPSITITEKINGNCHYQKCDGWMDGEMDGHRHTIKISWRAPVVLHVIWGLLPGTWSLRCDVDLIPPLWCGPDPSAVMWTWSLRCSVHCDSSRNTCLSFC